MNKETVGYTHNSKKNIMKRMIDSVFLMLSKAELDKYDQFYKNNLKSLNYDLIALLNSDEENEKNI